MRKKLNKFYWSYIIVSVVVIIVLAVFESTGFQMQENFKKDLRISLPDYTVEKIEKNDVCDSSDELIHAVKEYYIQFYEPLPVTSVNIVTEEKRGWHSDEQGGYYLNRDKGGEELFCYLNIEDKRLKLNTIMRICYLACLYLLHFLRCSWESCLLSFLPFSN